MIDYQVISADDHMDMIALPPTLWERLPANLRAKGPKVVPQANGNFWMYEGEVIGSSGFPKDRTYPSAIVRAGIPDDGFRPSNATLRLQDMDRDGVYAHVIYGPPTGLKIKNSEMKAACLEVYNTWAAEFNAIEPDRLCLLAYLPMHAPVAATAELNRVAKLGHKGAISSFFETSIPLHDAQWDVLWKAAEETGIPLSVHLGGGTHMIQPKPASWQMAAFAAVSPMQMDEVLASLIFSGALERHPKMKLVLGESGLGWIPYVKERLDHEFYNHGANTKDYRIKELPSVTFARQVYATFEEDKLGVKLLDLIGVDNVMWASDYPHPDSTFPHSRQKIEEAFKGVKPEVVKKVVADNARKLYKVGQKVG